MSARTLSDCQVETMLDLMPLAKSRLTAKKIRERAGRAADEALRRLVALLDDSEQLLEELIGDDAGDVIGVERDALTAGFAPRAYPLYAIPGGSPLAEMALDKDSACIDRADAQIRQALENNPRFQAIRRAAYAVLVPAQRSEPGRGFDRALPRLSRAPSQDGRVERDPGH